MRQKLYYHCFAALLVCAVYCAEGSPYLSFTEFEHAPDFLSVPFFHSDSSFGAVRSNDTIAVMGQPVYSDYVISSAPDFIYSFGAIPHFYEAVFNAPALEYHELSAWIRLHAELDGLFYSNGETAKALIHFGDHSLRVFWGEQGVPFDTTEFTNITLPDSAVVFFDCPVQISGMVNSTVIFGAAGSIGLEDDIVYANYDIDRHYLPEDATEKLVLATEQDIIVLNTWANGRDNSAQGNDIIINALLVALDGDSGQFTFENQNNPEDPYIGPSPDERGRIYFTGAYYQKYHGYVHRSNNSGTGYAKSYDFDRRLRYWELPLFIGPDIVEYTDSLDFYSVSVGDSVTDTMYVQLEFPALAGISPDFVFSDEIAPFHIQIPPLPYTFDSVFVFAVAFKPTESGSFEAEIPIYIEGNRYELTVSGTAILQETVSDDFIPHPSSFSLSSYPNPFNPTTTICFDLPDAGQVSLDIFNISGRKVYSLINQHYPAGSHSIEFNGSHLPSGVYFANLRSGTELKTIKLLLMK